MPDESKMGYQSHSLTEEPNTELKEYKEPRIQLLKNWEITIRILDVGCIISIGCKAIAFGTLEEGMDELNMYLEDPSEARKKWEKVESLLNNNNN